MAFCSKCGKEIPEGTTLCTACDAADKIVNTADTTASFDAADIQKNKGLSVLAYLSILILIPVFAAKGSKFARFHINQGLLLILADVVVNIAMRLLGFALGFLGGIGALLYGIIELALSITILVLMIMGIVNAAKGRAKQLPIIGGFTIVK